MALLILEDHRSCTRGPYQLEVYLLIHYSLCWGTRPDCSVANRRMQYRAAGFATGSRFTLATAYASTSVAGVLIIGLTGLTI